MSEHLRDRLHAEMSELVHPPADDLVARAEAQGVRTRRVRRTASGAGTVAVVGLTVLAVTIGSQLGTGPASTSVAGHAGAAAVTAVALKPLAPAQVVVAAAPTTSAPTTTAPVTASASDKAALAEVWHAEQQAASSASPPTWTAAPPGVPATPQGELQLFTELAKPYGTVSDVAVSDDADKTHVRARLTADGKTGGLQFSLEHDTLGYAADCLPGTPGLVRCDTTPDGGYAIVADDNGGCANTADINVVHPDGTAVHVFLSSCMADGANKLTPGTQTLSTADVEAIFQDSRFDFTMPADVVARGAQDIVDLPMFW